MNSLFSRFLPFSFSLMKITLWALSESARLSEIENGRLAWKAQNTSRCNHLTPPHFKGLIKTLNKMFSGAQTQQCYPSWWHHCKILDNYEAWNPWSNDTKIKPLPRFIMTHCYHQCLTSRFTVIAHTHTHTQWMSIKTIPCSAAFLAHGYDPARTIQDLIDYCLLQGLCLSKFHKN